MTPIKTIVHNNTPVSKTIHWAGKDTMWLEANADTEIPFEIWSVAEPHQREAILSSVASGSISLTIMVLNSDGTYTAAPFNPLGKEAQKQIVKEQQEAKSFDTTKAKIAEIDHTVKITSTETQSILEGMGAKRVGIGPNSDDEILPTREVKNGAPEPIEDAATEQPEEPAPVEATEKPAKKTRSKKS